MSNPNNPLQEINRRSVLRNIGITSVAAFSGVGTVAAADSQTSDQTIEPRTYEADIESYQEVQTAEITLQESGCVTKTLEIDTDIGSNDGQNSSEPTNTTYSLNLKADSDDVSAQSGQSEVRGPEDLTAGFAKEEQQAGGVNAQGLSKRPSLSGDDAVYYGQTESQECGPLARTNVRKDGSSFDADRDGVDGEACEGETWDQKFKSFCQVQRQFTGNCEVPDAFNTEWNGHVKEASNDKAGTIWGCPNFPAVSGTVVTAQYVEARGSNVRYLKTHGIVPKPPRWDSYELDMNGVANVATDLASLMPGIAPFTWALSLWLLADYSGVRQS